MKSKLLGHQPAESDKYIGLRLFFDHPWNFLRWSLLVTLVGLQRTVFEEKNFSDNLADSFAIDAAIAGFFITILYAHLMWKLSSTLASWATTESPPQIVTNLTAPVTAASYFIAMAIVVVGVFAFVFRSHQAVSAGVKIISWCEAAPVLVAFIAASCSYLSVYQAKNMLDEQKPQFRIFLRKAIQRKNIYLSEIMGCFGICTILLLNKKNVWWVLSSVLISCLAEIADAIKVNSSAYKEKMKRFGHGLAAALFLFVAVVLISQQSQVVNNARAVIFISSSMAYFVPILAALFTQRQAHENSENAILDLRGVPIDQVTREAFGDKVVQTIQLFL